MVNDMTLLLDLDGVSVARVERLADGRRRVHLVTADETARACPACGVFATRVKGSAVTPPAFRRRAAGWLAGWLAHQHPSRSGTEFRLDMDEVSEYRTPYRFLTYLLERRGYGIADDLYGDDRPDEVARLYQDARVRLGSSGRGPGWPAISDRPARRLRRWPRG
ncbi:hypothetical protein QFZ75_006589 [Streptomyces sp. V3I8]|uniref:hypothetical protein n=1 Tax=Streptomyces sp. V3I8 TaxID=3042279 RepID=UPI00277F15E6|nr:hypothetical protein [Streptomyces sp. V3I8]MDQ1040173.1 hypothetical protein [Streptomyces sp. V3I8]